MDLSVYLSHRDIFGRPTESPHTLTNKGSVTPQRVCFREIQRTWERETSTGLLRVTGMHILTLQNTKKVNITIIKLQTFITSYVCQRDDASTVYSIYLSIYAYETVFGLSYFCCCLVISSGSDVTGKLDLQNLFHSFHSLGVLLSIMRHILLDWFTDSFNIVEFKWLRSCSGVAIIQLCVTCVKPRNSDV